MNAWLSWRPDARIAQVVRGALRRGTRMSHYLFSIVGGFAVVLALALWLLPSWRGTFAARMMPIVSAAVQAGPARLLQGNPLPSFSGRRRTSAHRRPTTRCRPFANGADTAGRTSPQLHREQLQLRQRL